MGNNKDVFEDAEHLDDDDDDFEHDQDNDHDDGETQANSESDDSDERVVAEGEQTEEQELEARRERRRKERKQQREARKQRETLLRNEIAARDKLIENLAHRVQAMEQRGAGSEIQDIDNAINSLASSYVEAKQQLETAAEANNGKLVAQATERMQQIRIRAEQLAAVKNSKLQQAQAAQKTEPQVDPRLQNYASNWMSEHSWYKHGANDADSRRVKAIDDAIAAEGWNPNTPEYWEELSNRVRKELPHRYKNDYNERTQKRAIVSGSSRVSRESSQGTYQLSAERVAAMKELGIWDDPKRRAEMIAEYKKYDQANKVAR
jgi:hypothetical protein